MQYAVFPHDSQKFPQNFPDLLSKCSNSKLYLGLHIYQNEIISFAFEKALYGLEFDILGPYIRLILFGGFSIGKYGKTWENSRFSGRQ